MLYEVERFMDQPPYGIDPGRLYQVLWHSYQFNSHCFKAEKPRLSFDGETVSIQAAEVSSHILLFQYQLTNNYTVECLPSIFAV